MRTCGLVHVNNNQPTSPFWLKMKNAYSQLEFTWPRAHRDHRACAPLWELIAVTVVEGVNEDGDDDDDDESVVQGSEQPASPLPREGEPWL